MQFMFPCLFSPERNQKKQKKKTELYYTVSLKYENKAPSSLLLRLKVKRYTT